MGSIEGTGKVNATDTLTTLAPNDAPASSPVNLVIEVDDAHAAYEALRTRGVAFLTPPMRPPWGGWRCFATDPDGYVLEIEQPS